jgi:hypothetical protein
VTCEELAELLPDLMDDTLPAEIKAEALAALAGCPDCQKELEAARNIRAFLAKLQTGDTQLRVSAGFEARLFARIRREKHGLALVDLSSRGFGLWLIEFINIIGHLLNANSTPKPTVSQT